MKSTAVITPNLGLYLGQPTLGLDPRALIDGLNFRVYKKKLSNLNLGWVRFGTFTLNGPVLLIEDWFQQNGIESLLFATTTDVYLYDSDAESVSFLSPRYETGTASASGTAVTGTGTTWLTNAKVGDEIHFGAAGETDPAATWFGIQSVTNDTSLTLTATAGTVANGPYTIRKKFTGDLLNIWSTAAFYNASPSGVDEWWATNGVDDVIRWNGSDDQVEVMSALGFKCKVLGVYSNMMIFANITQSGTVKSIDIINSNTGEPQNVTSGISEQFKVHGNFGEIYSLVPIGDALAIYSRFTVTAAQFVGGDTIFAFRQVISNQGPIGFRAVADFGDYHQFIGQDGLYTFDGVSIREAGEHVWREVLRTVKPANKIFTFHTFNDLYAELIWVVPLTTDPTDAPTVAYAEHYLEDTGQQNAKIPFSRREFPFTSAGYFTRQDTLRWSDLTDQWKNLNFRWNDQFFSLAFPLAMVGDIDGKVYTLNTSQAGDGSDLASFVRFGRRSLFDGRVRGLLTRIYPFLLEGTASLDVTLHMSDSAVGSDTITDTQVLNFETGTIVSGGEYFTTHYRRGRFMDVQFGTDATGWELAGYDVDIRGGGRR